MLIREGLLFLLVLCIFCAVKRGKASEMFKQICHDMGDSFISLGIEKTTVIRGVSLVYCPPPRKSYLDYFKTLGIDVNLIEELILVGMPAKPPLREYHLTGLDLKRLIIERRPFFSSATYASTSVHYKFLPCLGTSGRNLDLSMGNLMVLECKENTLSDMIPVLPDRSVQIKTVDVTGCPPPDANESYAAILKSLNADVSAITVFQVKILPVSKLRASHFEGLSFRHLNISNTYVFSSVLIDPEDGFLEPLVTSLTSLHMTKSWLPPMPAASRLVNVTLVDGESRGKWGGCEELETLALLRWQVPKVEGWLTHCPRLKILRIEQLEKESVQRVLVGTGSLTTLYIIHCAFELIPGNLLKDATKLRYLQITGQKITTIQSEAFTFQSSLEVLDCSNNDILTLGSMDENALKPLQELRSFVLDRNPTLKFCKFGEIFTELEKQIPKLELLSLQEAGLKELCFEQWHTLSYLNLIGNKINTLEFLQLPTPLEKSLEVDLRNNDIIHIPSSEEYYHMMMKKFNQSQIKNMTVTVDLSLDCDCQYAWIAQALRHLPRLSVVGAICTSGEQLDRVQPEVFECNKTTFNNCTLRQAWLDSAVVADCSNSGLLAIPQVKDLRVLLASDNPLNTLVATDFIDSLIEVDLRRNEISHVSPDAAAALFSEPKRIVWLAGNRFACDCDNLPFIEALHVHKQQVQDFYSLRCFDEKKSVSEVILNDLCKAARERVVMVSAATLGSLLAAAALVFIMCYRYWQEIKVFLYARGWCLCCIREDEEETNRPYDVFISYAHGDEEFVATKLLPVFEREPHLKLCVHTRDWIPGEMIHTQVVRSVALSRRTIIVLSRNFVNSVWGMLEFRTAHMSALREGCVRVVVIVLDDIVDEDELDGELRGYLRTNTYLKWGDPWFWQKLLFALPHRRCSTIEPVTTSSRPNLSNNFSAVPRSAAQEPRVEIE